MIFNELQTHQSSSSEGNSAPYLANNNRYIKAELILEEREENDLHKDECESCSIPEVTISSTSTKESSSTSDNSVPTRRESKTNNVKFAMEGDKVKCETFPDTPYTKYVNPLKISPNAKDTGEKTENCSCHIDNKCDCLIDSKNRPTNTMVEYTENLQAPDVKGRDEPTTCSNRLSMISFGEGDLNIVNGFTDEVSEEIAKLLER